MKLKLSRQWGSWPETEYFQRLRSKGMRPQKHADFQCIEKDGKDLTGILGEHQYMPSHFRHDVRSDHMFRTLTQALDDVGSGRLPQWEGTGNAWTVIFKPDGAVFEYSIMDGEPGGKVSLGTYRQALEAWRDFLEDESCDERIIELPD